MQTEILIIGGGLAGLRLATLLQDAGRDYILVEARENLGGRILSETHLDTAFDLGPAWFWPGQPRMAALTSELGLQSFEQYASGDLLIEDVNSGVQRGRGGMSMQGSLRVAGGLGAIITQMAARIESSRINLSTPITSLTKTKDGICAQTEDGQQFDAKQVALALPPRLAAQIAFTPAFPEKTLESMNSISTWMGGQAKAVAIYETPFWREAGLSGDVMSRIGPMVEIHDASPADGSAAALFGFIGYPPHMRRDEAALREQTGAQLQRIFGPVAAEPKALLLKDWAQDPFTSAPLDLQPLLAHPIYGMPATLAGLWDKRILFAGTEVARQFGGYLEGALEAAENTFAEIMS